MHSMGREKGLARNGDLLEKYTPIPLAAQGMLNKSSLLAGKQLACAQGRKSCCDLGAFHCPLGKAVRPLCTAGETISELSPEFPAGMA